MLTVDAYIAAVTARLRYVRARITQARVGPVSALVAELDQVSTGSSQLHTYVVLAGLDEVDAFAVQDFTQHAKEHAWAVTPGIKGLSDGVVTIAALVSPLVRPDAVQAAVARPRYDWAGISKPVVIDVTSGEIWFFGGTPTWEWMLHDAAKYKILALLPPPAWLSADRRPATT